jgi:hypothetical protein
MGVDNCERSFEDLALRGFPKYLIALRKKMERPIALSEFAVSGHGPVTLRKRYGYEADPMGCYVILNKGEPIYVGISKHVIERIREHVRGTDNFTATLAYRIAFSRNPYKGTSKEAMRDTGYRSQFMKARDELCKMSVSIVPIDNPLELYLFEVYCAMELNTGIENGGWNTFQTH